MKGKEVVVKDDDDVQRRTPSWIEQLRNELYPMLRNRSGDLTLTNAALIF